MTTGKTIALTRQTFVDKVMSLLFVIGSQEVAKKYIHREVPCTLHPCNISLNNSVITKLGNEAECF